MGELVINSNNVIHKIACNYCYGHIRKTSGWRLQHDQSYCYRTQWMLPLKWLLQSCAVTILLPFY